jgi:hypothetical protein
MSSTEKTATFMFANKSISIQCQGKQKLIEVIKKYLNKLNPNSRIAEYYFYY